MHHMRPRRPTRRTRRRRALYLLIVMAALVAGLACGATSHVIGGSGCPPTSRPVPPASDPGASARAARAFAQPRNTGRARTASPGAVVAITAQLADGSGVAGAGIVLSSTGLVLTNQHVVAGAVELEATTAEGSTYPVVIVGVDPDDDIALIQLDGATGLPTVRAGDHVWVGEPVTAIGNAWGSQITVTRGMVTRLHQTISATARSAAPSTGSSEPGTSRPGVLRGLIGVDAGIVPGDSGGALVDDDGRVVGVIVAYIPAGSADTHTEAATGEGYAIPIGSALRAAANLAHDAGLHTAIHSSGSVWAITTRSVHQGRGR